MSRHRRYQFSEHVSVHRSRTFRSHAHSSTYNLEFPTPGAISDVSRFSIFSFDIVVYFHLVVIPCSLCDSTIVYSFLVFTVSDVRAAQPVIQ